MTQYEVFRYAGKKLDIEWEGRLCIHMGELRSKRGCPGACGDKTRLLLAAAVMMMTSVFANPESQRSLGPCPDSPNCVSSQSSDSSHFIEPFRLTVAPERGWDALKAVLQAMQRVKIVEESDGYIHAEATSRMFRFVDDVEFLMRPDGQFVDVRSASRVGYSDFGVNRRRIERIRQELMADVAP